MLNNDDHPLFGKETSCHKCSGVAVWVPAGLITGYYHYCRACKVETGPFAANIQPPIQNETPFTVELGPDGSWVFKTGFLAQQIDTQMQMQDRMEQLLFDFMKPTPLSDEETHFFTDMADHPV